MCYCACDIVAAQCGLMSCVLGDAFIAIVVDGYYCMSTVDIVARILNVLRMQASSIKIQS